MTPRERMLQALKGEKVSPMVWGDQGVSVNVVTEAFGIKLDPIQGEPPDADFFLQVVERQKKLCGVMDTGCFSAPRYYTMAPRIRNADNSGVLTNEASLVKLEQAFVELDQQHWDDLKRLVDAKGDYAMFAPISTGIGHIWQTMDMMAFSVATVENKPLLHTILKMYTEWTCRVIDVCNSIGIDMFWSFDDFAFKTGLVYSPAFFREIVLPYAQEVARAIKLPWVFHSDGDYIEVLDDIIGLGMNALNPVEPGNLDIPGVRRRYPEMVLIGNVQVDVLARGTVEEVRADVDRCFRELGETGPFIPASSNSIPDFCKPENVRAMFDRLRELGKKD